MRFTNPGYYDLDAEVIEAEFELLAPLHDEHARQLWASGAAERIIRSAALSNRRNRKDDLGESSMTWPHRRYFWNLSQVMSDPLKHDIGFRAPDYGMEDPVGRVIDEPGVDNFGLYVSRQEMVYRGHQGMTYAAGVLLTQESADQLGVATHLPVPGVEVADLKLLEAQLQALTDFAAEHDIKSFDQATRSQGDGELIKYEFDA